MDMASIRFKTNVPEKDIVVALSYSKGDCYGRRRGYYVTAYPEKTEVIGGVAMRSFVAFSGTRYFIKEVGRASKKAQEEASNMMYAGAKYYAETVASNNGLTIVE